MNPRIRIVVCSYRTDDELAGALESIRRTLAVPHEVVVVDTSEDQSALVALSSDRGLGAGAPGTRALSPGNVGYAAALNLGFEGATAPMLIGMNADVRFPAEGIDALLALFGEHPRLGVLGPRQVNDQNRVVHAGIEVLGDTMGGRSFMRVDVGQCREKLRDVAQVSGSVMLMRRSALEDCGGIPQPALLYFEDAALCRRMRELNWRVAYSGLVTFRHRLAASPEPQGTTRAALASQAREAFLGSRTYADHGAGAQ